MSKHRDSSMLRLTSPSYQGKTVRLYGTVEVEANLDDAIEQVGFAIVDVEDISQAGPLASDRRRLLADLNRIIRGLQQIRDDFQHTYVKSPERLRKKSDAVAVRKSGKLEKGLCKPQSGAPKAVRSASFNAECAVKVRLTPIYEI